MDPQYSSTDHRKHIYLQRHAEGLVGIKKGIAET